MANYNLGITDGYPMVDIESDDENAESSDDDICNQILHGTPGKNTSLRNIRQSSSSEDEFEKEMNCELNENIRQHSKKNQGTQQNILKSGSQADGKLETLNEPKLKTESYDDEYFDSDDDDSATGNTKRNHPVISNDDLLYDPGMDEADQKWVDSHRQDYLKTEKNKGVKPLPHSDAVLNCPACMTLLSLDCQRHSVYHNQYRAMFVQNCSVDETERLKFPTDKSKRGKKKKAKLEELESAEPGQSSSAEELYNPVRCSICTTEVGVYDKDEVYHFFNVLSSYS